VDIGASTTQHTLSGHLECYCDSHHSYVTHTYEAVTTNHITIYEQCYCSYKLKIHLVCYLGDNGSLGLLRLVCELLPHMHSVSCHIWSIEFEARNLQLC